MAWVQKQAQRALGLGSPMQQVQAELTAAEKAGYKFTLGMANARKEMAEDDVLDVINDPMTSSQLKIQSLHRLIVHQAKEVALFDNPKLWDKWVDWNDDIADHDAFYNLEAETRGHYAVVDLQIPHPYQNGMVQIRTERQKLNEPDFMHEAVKYLTSSEWQTKMKEKYGPTYGLDKWKSLEFKVIEEVNELNTDLTVQQIDVLERERKDKDDDAKKHVIPSGWILYGGMQRDKFTFPDTPLVLQPGPQVPGAGSSTIVPTSSLRKPPQSSAAGMQS